MFFKPLPSSRDLQKKKEEKEEKGKEEEDSLPGTKSGRERKRCPLVYCKAKVVHMPRHLQDVHGWTKEHARTALQRFGLRKAYTYSDPSKVPKTKKKTSTQDETEKKEGTKIKDYHHYRYCPVVGYASLVKRLPART